MRLSGWCVGLALMPLPLWAQSDCPVSADMDAGGIAFVIDAETDVQVHTRAPNGVITVTANEDANGLATVSVLAHGVHVLQLFDLQDGVVVSDSIWRFAFPMPTAELPAPTPGESWTVRTTSLIDGVSEVEDITHVWGGVQRFNIGRCSYDAIPVRATYDGESYDHVEESVYFPDLGTAILLRYSDADESYTYSYTDIRTQ